MFMCRNFEANLPPGIAVTSARIQSISRQTCHPESQLPVLVSNQSRTQLGRLITAIWGSSARGRGAKEGRRSIRVGLRSVSPQVQVAGAPQLSRSARARATNLTRRTGPVTAPITMDSRQTCSIVNKHCAVGPRQGTQLVLSTGGRLWSFRRRDPVRSPKPASEPGMLSKTQPRVLACGLVSDGQMAGSTPPRD